LEVYTDIFIEKVLNTFKKELTNVEQLRGKMIYTIDPNTDEDKDKWSMYKCLIVEVSLNDKMYCLNSGKWYQIDNDFVTKINEEYNNIEISKKDFIDFDSSKDNYHEDEYNDDLEVF